MSSLKLSILIATFNSQRTLGKVLKSIKDQNLNKDFYEVLIIDGGSNDNTLDIARKYNCIIINNEMTDPLNAKYLGYNNSQGRYLLALDHDEVLVNKNSLKRRLSILDNAPDLHSLHSTGYITPNNSNPVNYYINEFGDPFSFFIYGLSKDYRFFINSLRKKYKVAFENDDYIRFKYEKNDRPPLMELLAGGAMFDKVLVSKFFKKLEDNKEKYLPHLHLHLMSVDPYFTIIKNDPLYHYSAENFSSYIKKLQWRVKNNIFFRNTSGAAGFLQREFYEKRENDIKKFLFIPYGISIFVPLLDSINLIISRRKLYYIMHLPLVLFVIALIIYYKLKKLLGSQPLLTSYDGNKKILKKWK